MNMKIPFYKMSGSGNDFIIIDNRGGAVAEESLDQLIVGACRRKKSAGADGLILVEESTQVDFKWRFFNADGSRAEMCGNGARCAARFACITGISGPELAFETDAGIVSAQVIQDRVKIRMTDPTGLQTNQTLAVGDTTLPYDFINTGVPHVVMPADDIEQVDVVDLGRAVRQHERFSPAGTNVNFVQPIGRNAIAVRTYERGVEDETLACGTGCAAASLMMRLHHHWDAPVEVKTRSGEMLRIYFEEEAGAFRQVHLEGGARVIYTGTLWEEAWQPA